MPSWICGGTVPANTARLKSYDLAAEAAKQELTIAAAISAVGATFLKDIFQHPSLEASVLAGAGFLLLIVSIAFGTRTLFLLVSCIADVKTEDAEGVPVITASPKLKRVARNQHICFVCGLALFVLFGVVSAFEGSAFVSKLH
jgi:hypothetical protein